MTPPTDVADEVRQTAAVLVEAFGHNDLDRYLTCFREDATFLFHTTDRRLTSREEYRRELSVWVRDDDFRVLGCETSGTRVQVLGDTAVLTHDVHTTVSTTAGREQLRERGDDRLPPRAVRAVAGRPRAPVGLSRSGRMRALMAPPGRRGPGPPPR